MVDAEQLRRWAQEGRSIRWMAAELGLSYTATRARLARAGVSTARTVRLAATSQARAAGLDEVVACCPVHGEVRMVRRPDGGFRCNACRTSAVSDRRRRIKAQLVAEAGGGCQLCGYSEHLAALHFHHLDPALKTFSLAARGVCRSIERARAEATKCVLLCANCHAAVEAGGLQLPSAAPRLRVRHSGVAQSGRAFDC